MTNDHMADEGGRGMSEHTEGPWRKRQVTGTCDLNIMGKDELVCTIPYKFGPVEKRAANAALIIAAPELKAALEAIVAADDRALAEFRAMGLGEPSEEMKELTEQGRAALKAARGGGE